MNWPAIAATDPDGDGYIEATSEDQNFDYDPNKPGKGTKPAPAVAVP
jgi:hypothetical protein